MPVQASQKHPRGKKLLLGGGDGVSLTPYARPSGAFTFSAEQSAIGSISYVPNAKAYPEGSCEVDSARLMPGGGELFAPAATRMLTELFARP